MANFPSQIPEPKYKFIKKFLRSFISPIYGMLTAASVLSFVADKNFDGYFILALLALNLASVFRNGKWEKIDSKEISLNLF